MNSYALKHLFFWGRSATTKFAQKPQKYSFQRATNVTFSNFGGQKLTALRAVFLNLASCNLISSLMDEVIQGQRFWEVVWRVVCFTAVRSYVTSWVFTKHLVQYPQPKKEQKVTHSFCPFRDMSLSWHGPRSLSCACHDTFCTFGCPLPNFMFGSACFRSFRKISCQNLENLRPWRDARQRNEFKHVKFL